MTTTYYVDDTRSSYPSGGIDCSGTVRTGTYRMKNATGVDRTPGQLTDLHPYNMQFVHFREGEVTSWNHEQPWTQYYECRTNYGFSASAFEWTANDQLQLLNKLQEKYDQHNFSGLTAGAELGKATDMLAQRVKQLAEVARAVKKGNLKKAAEVLRGSARPHKDRYQKQTLSGLVLETQYGIRPLLSDIYQLSKAIAVLDQPRKRRVRASGWKGIEVTCTNPYLNCVGVGIHRVSIVAYLTEVIPFPGEALGLSDPTSTAWELVPFSFVIDWVLPIGDWLRARNFASRARGEFVLTKYTKWSGKVTGLKADYVPDTSFPYKGGVKDPNAGFYTWINLDRTVSTALTVPLPNFEMPFKGPGERLLNAVALAAAVFGGGNTRYGGSRAQFDGK